MKTPKVLILRTAGTNCDNETKYAFEKAGAVVEVIHINALLNNKKILENYQLLALPGGFTYGDDVAAGKILANQIKYHLEDEIKNFIAAKKLILGICNGFQVLVRAGLLPSFERFHQEATLTHNDSNKFEDRWVYLKICADTSYFIRREHAPILYLPVAHGEGKFLAKDKDVLDKMVKNRQIVFQYVDKNGEDAGYPMNPNGSVLNIAGICDQTGQILGMMPHPERNVDPTQQPYWTRQGLKDSGDGFLIFKNAVQYMKEIF